MDVVLQEQTIINLPEQIKNQQNQTTRARFQAEIQLIVFQLQGYIHQTNKIRRTNNQIKVLALHADGEKETCIPLQRAIFCATKRYCITINDPQGRCM